MRTDMSEWSARLAALGGFQPPAAGWQAVLAARKSRETRASLAPPVAVGAAVLAVVAALGFWLQSAQRELSRASLRIEPAVVLAAEMRAENERLERLLAALPESRAMRGSTAFTVAELEDRLALLDDRLSRVTLEPNAPEHAEELWRERVKVMNSLVQVRYAEAIGTY
jgi:hypothetical protein